ncbi:hypothetical protein [Sphingomonas sp. Mn802worker]|uniref:hypothetical protein n=1 Tax=Sphingomonas sp. Mn802worker TaxID=629773 RepID=UPI000361A770|nr:hypothetical protein [Sphingomonas sp. Mn802worker]
MTLHPSPVGQFDTATAPVALTHRLALADMIVSVGAGARWADELTKDAPTAASRPPAQKGARSGERHRPLNTHVGLWRDVLRRLDRSALAEQTIVEKSGGPTLHLPRVDPLNAAPIADALTHGNASADTIAIGGLRAWGLNGEHGGSTLAAGSRAPAQESASTQERCRFPRPCADLRDVVHERADWSVSRVRTSRRNAVVAATSTKETAA